ncbi:MAG: hypothetical protein C4330_06905 [Chitinophagaceae bacterium]
MDFQLSVFHEGHYLSYTVSTDDKKVYQFNLKSFPPSIAYHPEKFTITRNGKTWATDIDLNDEFKKDLLQQLKKQKV